MLSVIIGGYRDLFMAIATTAAALTGLLFVAISVTPSRSSTRGVGVIHEVRAAASLVAFVNALAVSLFGLVPGQNVGYPAVVVGVIGVFFTAAGTRSIFARAARQLHRRRQLGWLTALLVTFGFELSAGIELLIDRRSRSPVALISNLLIASLLIGVARAWELVGRRDTGIIASLAVLVGRDSTDPGRLPEGSDPVVSAGAAQAELRPGTGTGDTAS